MRPHLHSSFLHGLTFMPSGGSILRGVSMRGNRSDRVVSWGRADKSTSGVELLLLVSGGIKTGSFVPGL